MIIIPFLINWLFNSFPGKFKWVKLFKNGPSKIYERQPLKNLK